MNNTIYYAAELMIYFEKHNFLEVIKALLVRLAIDRPHSLKYYIRKHLSKIASSVLTKNTIVHLPPGQDVEELEKSILKLANIPLVICNRRTDKAKFEEIMLKFEKHEKKHGILNKIILNCPENYEEVLRFHKCHFVIPTNFINITVNDLNKDMAAITAEVLHTIKYSPIPISNGVGCNYVYRIVLIGRRGSGRQTQAKLLAARYNLVYVNIETLIEQTLQSKDNMAKMLSIAFKKQNYYSTSAITALIYKRLMQPDTLSRGWIVVNFPKSINELEILVKKFQIPPNRFLILHCCKSVALRRLVKQWETSNIEIELKNTITHVEKEFTDYDKNITSMYSYLKSVDVQTIHVNGKGCSDLVKNKIFSLLER